MEIPIRNDMTRDIGESIMNIFAAIDLETTGLDPNNCEVLEVAIVPLNPDFTISTDIPEFSCRIRAEHPERADLTALNTNHLNPTEGEKMIDVRAELVQWAVENGITSITPLAHNLAFDMAFMKTAFPEFSRIFTHHGRDSMRLALSMNDVFHVQQSDMRFGSVSLQSLKLALGVEGDVQHNALEDARDTAHVYRKLMALLRAA